MKKTRNRFAAFLAALLIAALLAACGGQQAPAEEETKKVDLTAVYSDIFAALREKEPEVPEDYLVDIEGEMLEYNYAGLSEIPTEQFVAKMPMMSAVACEVVLMECQSAEDADKAQKILQARIDYQVGDDETPGGAWYPETIESWKRSSVQRQGNYVALLAVDGIQSQAEEIFNGAFAA